MRKEPGCLSPVGLLVALCVVVAVAGYTWFKGGGLFNPGPLTAANTRDTTLEGYRSHAEFEDQCTRCHRPWLGVEPARCLDCHTNLRDQIRTGEGLHGKLENPELCTGCHTEHQGRTADISAAALTSFSHQQVGFSLARHRRLAVGGPFACVDCHPNAKYEFDQALCKDCHAQMDAAFTAQHVIDFSQNCLGCHDGSGAMAGFDHNVVFALEGAHADLACADCHVADRYKGLPSDCVACHDEPEVHLGQFGTDCAACHTAEAWTPARLQQHTFPLDHGSRSEVDCQVCHPTNYVSYTCYDCHEHDPNEVAQEHREEGIRDFEDCVECHATGRETEDEGGEEGGD